MKSMIMTLMCAVMLMGLSSCSDDDDEVLQDDTAKVAYYKFEFVLQTVEGSDNADIINTTLHYVDQNGKDVEKNVSMTSKTFTIQSQPYTTIPGELVVTLNEELKPDAKLDKEVYKMGSNITFTVSSFNQEGKQIGIENMQNRGSRPLKKEQLFKTYPKATVFHYMIDANGKVSKK